MLVGRTVVRVEYLSPIQTEELCWQYRPAVLVFDDGTVMYSMSDEVGNDGGVLMLEKGNNDLCLGRFPV